MAALATIDDVIALGVDPTTVTQEMLDSASARFRAEAGGNQIEATTYRQVLRPIGGFVRLTRTPVVSIDAVKLLTDQGTPGAEITGWTFDGIDTLDSRGLDEGAWINGPTWDDDRRRVNIWVEWQAGFDPIPEDVRWTVAQMVKRASEAGPSGVTSEQIGDYSRSFGSYTASGAMSMTKDEREVAHRYRVKRTTFDVGVG